MDLTALVDVAIGLIVIYLGTSLFVTVLNEYLSQTLKLRGRQLARDLVSLINGDNNAQKVIDYLKSNPALTKFFESGRTWAVAKIPSYIDPKVLAQVLIGGAQKDPTTKASLETVVTSLKSLPESKLKTQLLALSQSSSKQVDDLIENVSKWADQTLTMMGEVYKKKLQWISFGIGLVVAVVFNIDTVAVTTRLYRDKDARAAAVKVAESIAVVSKDDFNACLQMSPEKARSEDKCKRLVGLVETVREHNQKLGTLPFGRPEVDSVGAFFTSLQATQLAQIVGWLLTALALSLGAPFWFDFLNKLVNVRHGMRKPDSEG
jgi:hypothetical protein